jgi:hypothetical protein
VIAATACCWPCTRCPPHCIAWRRCAGGCTACRMSLLYCVPHLSVRRCSAVRGLWSGGLHTYTRVRGFHTSTSWCGGQPANTSSKLVSFSSTALHTSRAVAMSCLCVSWLMRRCETTHHLSSARCCAVCWQAGVPARLLLMDSVSAFYCVDRTARTVPLPEPQRCQLAQQGVCTAPALLS